ncbi:quinone-dependent dihydroorotate dehydrogenase [Candidatus Pelagibacter sp.]|nr:quinone-dependent dihydroorotate dehydrogenase [Candidatus Pelagibacter sp.]
MFNLIRPFIFKFSPEVAHSLAIKALKLNQIPAIDKTTRVTIQTKFLNKTLNSPLGVAAGFDKNAEVYNPLYKLGFGFVEVGTITPKPQIGNPKPRVFRLEEDEALINRLGFNNIGLEESKKNIENNSPNGLLGINIGPNKDTKNRVEDYLICFRKFHNLADYITINISSPNTENLRNFHKNEELDNLLKCINEEKKNLNSNVPIAVKVSPDIDEKSIDEISELFLKYNVQIVIVSNTTDRNRENISNINKLEKGGLSGKPLENISNELINKFFKLVGKKISIIGVGGVDSADGVFNKIASGATLVQLYTGMVYKGPTIASKINKDLDEIVKREGFKNISEAIGTKN